MNTAYCEAERPDDPRFALTEATFDPPPGTWAPDCGHAACVDDDRAHTDWHDYDCPVAQCRWDTARDACDLPGGHAGDHRYQLPLVAAVAAP